MKTSTKDFFLIANKTNGRCFYCNKTANAVDHFISREKWREWDLENTPLKGGLNHPENLFPCCNSCNSKKSDKCPEDFIGSSYIAWKRCWKANVRVGLMQKRDYEALLINLR